jgi:small subunit ribosomal protein S20
LERIEMANTSSAKKATRKIARRTAINKMRDTRMRGTLRAVEEAITAGDGKKAREALSRAEPEIMRAAQKGVIHKNSASRKVSRLEARVRKLGS